MFMLCLIDDKQFVWPVAPHNQANVCDDACVHACLYNHSVHMNINAVTRADVCVISTEVTEVVYLL